MSVEEDTELRDLVSQALESKGVLAKIRAELRASVFLTLEEQMSTESKHPFQNKRLKEFLHTTEGALTASLVKEFLEFFNLEYTLSVFESESYCGSEFCTSSRDELLKQLNLAPTTQIKSSPLMAVLAQQSLAMQPNGDLKSKPDIVNGNHSPEPKIVADEKPVPDKNLILFSPAINAPTATETRIGLNEGKKGNDCKQEISPDRRTEKQSLLGPLPPLQTSPGSISSPLDRTKTLGEQPSPLDSLDNNYEEDFELSLSGGSHAEQPKSKDTTEVEEEVASEEPASGSVGDELTLDTSVSLSVSGPLADHLESI